MNALELLEVLEEAFERKNREYWHSEGHDVEDITTGLIASVFRDVREKLESK